jgi:hypothetical protein
MNLKDLLMLLVNCDEFVCASSVQILNSCPSMLVLKEMRLIKNFLLQLEYEFETHSAARIVSS